MFCSECGTKVEAAFCTNCGTAAASSTPVKVETYVATPELVVMAQILEYVADNWSDDFEEFLEEIEDEIEIARAISQDHSTEMTVTEFAALESEFSRFISGGGYPPSRRFDSLEDFIAEMDS